VSTLFVIATVLVLAGCGGGGSGSDGRVASVVNYAPLVADAGPEQVNAVNTVYTTVTVCAPGSSTACQTIDHVLVDTGSSGFRVLAETLGSGVTAAQMTPITDSSGNALAECMQFVDGYSWGSVKLADVRVGGEVASSVPIQVIGDPAYPASTIPNACINIPNAEEDTVATFGANGVLGVGSFIQDCGEGCAPPFVQDGSEYNLCTTLAPITCQPAAVSLTDQVTNPVVFFDADNNGVLIEMDAVSDSGAPSAAGTLVFGIDTQFNNALGSASVYTLDPNNGTLLTNFAGVTLSTSVIDSGSNGYYFPGGSIPACKDQPDFFCPSSVLSLTAEIQGLNGTLADLAFSVANADQFPATDAVLPDLAGSDSSSTPTSFDWGLPFFLGRPVFIALEGTTLAGQPAPAVAF